MFNTFYILNSNSLSLKYQKLTSSGWEDIGIKKLNKTCVFSSFPLDTLYYCIRKLRNTMYYCIRKLWNTLYYCIRKLRNTLYYCIRKLWNTLYYCIRKSWNTLYYFIRKLWNTLWGENKTIVLYLLWKYYVWLEDFLFINKTRNSRTKYNLLICFSLSFFNE